MYQNNYEKVCNDPEIISLYKKIHSFEEKTNGWAYHDLAHVKNVSSMMDMILKQLGYHKSFIDEAKIAGILHDTGCLEGKNNQAIRSYDFAKNYIKKRNLQLNYRNEILEAIKIHSSGFETQNTIALILIFCDKLDVTKSRIAPAGLKDIGIRQFQYFSDIQIQIIDEDLIINFIYEKHLNFIELESFYFTKKIFSAIHFFSSSLHLNPIVQTNGIRWDTYYMNMNK